MRQNELKLSRLSENVNELSKKKELIQNSKSIIQKSPKHTPRQITWGETSLVYFSFLVINHHFKWWFNIGPPKGHSYCSPRRAVPQALLLVRYKAVPLESSFLDSSACSLIYFCTASSVILPIVST